MSDRYNDVKILLKNWERTFLQEHERKPNKDDIDNGPEETKRLYKEYRTLKEAKENNNSTHEAPTQTSETNKTTKEPDCWGSHLSRKNLPVAPPKLTTIERESLQASAQYFGMKLKLNLGSLTKDRPVTLKKSYTPRKTPLKTCKGSQEESCPPSVTADVELPLPKPANTCPDPSATPAQATNTDLDEEPLEPFKPLLAFTPSKAWRPTPGASGSLAERAQQLRQSVTKRLSSVDHGWLQRCQVFDEVDDCERPVSGNVEDPGESDGHTPSPLAASSSAAVAELLPARASPNKPAPGGDGAARNTPTHPQPPDDRPQMGGVTSPSEAACLRDKGHGSSLEPSVGGGGGGEGGEGDGETRPGLGGAGMGAEWVVTERASGIRAAKKPRARARKGLEEEEEEEEEPVQTKKRGKELRVRARKGQEEEDEEEPVQTKKRGKEPKPMGAQKKGRKRPRDEDEEEEEEKGDGEQKPADAEEKQGTAKKRRRTKKGETSTLDSPEKARGPRGRKKKGTGSGGDGGDGSDPEELEKKVVKQKPRIPQENLLGEVDVEDVMAARSRVKNSVRPTGTKNTDGNFVKINLKKKSHVKGYALRGAGLRKQMYMQKFQLKGERFGGFSGRGRGGFSGRGRGGFGGFNRQGDTCFKCGGTGHWASNCQGKGPAAAVAAGASDAEEEEPFELPTLEEVARATGSLSSEPIVVAPPSAAEDADEQKDKQEEILLNVIRPDYERPTAPPPMEPLYSLTEDGKVRAAPEEVFEALRAFGYKSFRPGQEVALMRILSGLSTLVVLSTGMGKSLVYQLAAYLYAQRSNCIALVISPLVSLMDDQLTGLPSILKAAAIHSNMSKKQRETAIEKVKAGQVHVLLLSPEALVGGGHSGAGCLPPADQLPPVAFACVDEAHCVSEWSHNFRPCYLRLCKVLRDRLGVRCLLGLTATATLSTALDIAHHLEITDEDGIAVRSAAVPPNLQLSVSMDRDKDQALVCLLKGERFGALGSIIIYCTRREETTRISALLRTCLQGVIVKEPALPAKEDDNPVGKKKKALARKKIRKPIKWIAESYHAGMSGSERRRVQNNFMCGELRVVVATVAFGMGLDKSDVRGIIHYNMPKSFESYVQEIGRAGRDAEPSHCHLFLDPEGGDLHELRRHIYSDTVDYITVKKLVQKVFPPCKCRQIHQKHQEVAKAMEVDDDEMLGLMDACEGFDDGEQPGVEPPKDTPMDETPYQTPNREEKNVPLSPTAKGGPQTQSVSHPQEEGSVGETPGGERKEDTSEGEKGLPVTQRVCHTHERAIPMQDTVEALDITEEGLETLLCYLELHPQAWVELLHPTLSNCSIQCYGGSQQLRTLTKICPPVAVALARKRMAGEKVEACSGLEFDVVELADTMGWQCHLVKRGLRQLQWGSGTFGGTGRSGVHVEFSSLSFYFRSYGDLTPDEMDQVCAFLHGRVKAQEMTQLYQLKASFKAFRSVAYRNCSLCVDELEEERSLKLKELLSEYFDKRRDLDMSKEFQQDQDEEEESLNKFKMKDWEDQIRADIRGFLANRSDEKFSGRAVARIFHGIGSPCYPPQIYGRDRRYWRKYIQFDFNEIIRFATQEIIRTK